MSAKCRRNASAVATAEGPLRNGRTRISATVTIGSDAGLRPVATKPSKSSTAFGLPGSPPARYARTIELSMRTDAPGGIASPS
jgi:hypothetical protein